MPFDHSSRLHDGKSILPEGCGQKTGQNDPEDSINLSDAGFLDGSFIDKKLMSQHEIFGYEVTGDEEL